MLEAGATLEGAGAFFDGLKNAAAGGLQNGFAAPSRNACLGARGCEGGNRGTDGMLSSESDCSRGADVLGE